VYPYPLDQISLSFPTQLTKLAVRLITFTHDSRPDGQLQILSCLTNLELENVVIDGVLQDYIICPNLEQLSFHYTSEMPDYSKTTKLKKKPGRKIRKILNQEFFQGVPNLRSLSILGHYLNDTFLYNLQPCTLLETLRVKECEIQTLIPFFPKYLREFSSLTIVRIDDSWPQHSNISYREFIRSCGAEKPGVCIYGNGRVRI
jgi:hypothetical protein